jgi:hypothetical protein
MIALAWVCCAGLLALLADKLQSEILLDIAAVMVVSTALFAC